MMSYPKQKETKSQINHDMRKFSRTAKKTKKININPRILRGGIRL